MERVLEKGDFPKFFEDLKREYIILGPTRRGSTTTYAYLTFGYIESIKDLELDYQLTMLPSKKVFLPSNEALFGFKKVDENVFLEDLAEKWEKRRALLGIHPCEIVALSRLDKVFGEVYKDPYYWNRRENTLIIGVTCNRPSDYCFCNVTDSGPDIDEGYDLLITDIADCYFFKTGSEVGESLVRTDYFKDASLQHRQRREHRLEEVSKVLKDVFKLGGIVEVMKEKYSDKVWDEYWKTCVACGVCNMVCPTCHCFAMIDRANAEGTQGRRVRIWDSCHFERFAQMAGGLNPREEKSSRFKHRLYDKFYYTPIRYGVTFCVGCGRCTEFCQSGIDIRDPLRRLQGR